MVTVPFVSLAEIKDYLEITSTSGDGRVTNLISYACSVVEDYIGREVLSNDYTEYHDGGVRSVFVDRIPINNVNAVFEYQGSDYMLLNGPNADGSLPVNVSANSNTLQYMWYSETGKITRHTQAMAKREIEVTGLPSFDNYPKGVKVEYNGGYDVAPGDLKQATLDYIKLLYKNLPETATISFQGESRSVLPLSSGFPPHIRRILDFYRVII